MRKSYFTEADLEKELLPVRQPNIWPWDSRALSASPAASRLGRKQVTPSSTQSDVVCLEDRPISRFTPFLIDDMLII